LDDPIDLSDWVDKISPSGSLIVKRRFQPTMEKSESKVETEGLKDLSFEELIE